MSSGCARSLRAGGVTPGTTASCRFTHAQCPALAQQHSPGQQATLSMNTLPATPWGRRHDPRRLRAAPAICAPYILTQLHANGTHLKYSHHSSHHRSPDHVDTLADGLLTAHQREAVALCRVAFFHSLCLVKRDSTPVCCRRVPAHAQHAVAVPSYPC